MEFKKQKRIHLDFYPRRRNLRFTGVKENGDNKFGNGNDEEDCEKLARKILDEMGVLRYGIDLHAVYRAPRVVPSQTEKQDTSRKVIMRFTSGKDRDRAWVKKKD